MKIHLHGTQDECREMAGLLAQIMTIQAVSEPYPDRSRSVLVRVYVEGIPRPAAEDEAQPAPRLPRLRPMGACCDRAVYDDSTGWWCPEHGDQP